MTYYRYDYYNIEGGTVSVYLCEYEVVKQTPKGVWVGFFGDKHFVLNESRKKFAWPTKELAKESFIIRKKRQIGHCKSTIISCELALEEINKVLLG